MNSRTDIAAFLQKNPAWQHSDNTLARTFQFADFVQAFGWMSSVALVAERMGHHPDWRNVWATVEVKLCTHDAGNVVTQRDLDLAAEMDRLAGADKSRAT